MSDRVEDTFVLLRYSLGGDRPSQTTQHALFLKKIKVRTSILQGWYFKDDSTMTSVKVSKSPTYPTQIKPEFSANL